MKNETIAMKTANRIIELYGSTLLGRDLEKAAIDVYCDICNFSKKYILQDLDYDNVSDVMSCYHAVKK